MDDWKKEYAELLAENRLLNKVYAELKAEYEKPSLRWNCKGCVADSSSCHECVRNSTGDYYTS